MSQTNVNVPSSGSDGIGAGMIVGLLIAIVIIGFLVWYFLLNGSGRGGGTPADSTTPLQSLVESILPTGS